MAPTLGTAAPTGAPLSPFPRLGAPTMRLRFSLAVLLATLLSLPATAQTARRFSVPTARQNAAQTDASRIVGLAGGREALTGLTARRGGDEGEFFSGIALGTSAVPATPSAARGFAFGFFLAGKNDFEAGIFVDGLEGGFQSAEVRSGAPGAPGALVAEAGFVEDNETSVRVEFEATLTDPQVAQLQAGNLFIVVKTSAFPAGEVRAQLRPTDFIDAARARAVGSTVSVLAYVARAKGAFTYLNDGTGGIAVRQTSGPLFEAVQSGAVRPGTVVRVEGVTSEFRGLLQINNADLTRIEIANDVGENVNAFAEQVTLEQIVADPESYESVLVAVTDVTIGGGTGGTFTAATSYSADDGTAPASPVVVRVPNAADTEVPGQPIPTEPVVVLGVVGQFTQATPAVDGYQLLVIEDYDVDPRGTVQVVHNSADPALATVRVLTDGLVVLDSTLAFRTSTGPLDVPALEFGSIAVTAGDENVLAVGFYDSIPGDPPTVLVLQGVSDPEAFAPNPDGFDTSLYLDSFNGLPSAGAIGTASTFGIVLNGATDAQAFGVLSGSLVLTDDIPFSFVGAFLTPAAPATLSLEASEGSASYGAYAADFSALGGQFVFLLASGFVEPADNQNGAALGLLAVTQDGTATLLRRLGVAAEAAPGAAALRVAAVANPVRAQTRVRYTLGAAGPARVSLFDALGREVAVLAEGDARGRRPRGGARRVPPRDGRVHAAPRLGRERRDRPRDGRPVAKARSEAPRSCSRRLVAFARRRHEAPRLRGAVARAREALAVARRKQEQPVRLLPVLL